MINTTEVLQEAQLLLRKGISPEEIAKIIAISSNSLSDYQDILDLVEAEATESLAIEPITIENDVDIKDATPIEVNDNDYIQYKNRLGIKEEDVESVKSYMYPNGMVGFSVKFKEGKGQQGKKDLELLDELKLSLGKYLDSRTELKGKTKYDDEAKKNGKVGVVPLADFHIGAFIEGLIKTEDFSVAKVIEYLDTVATIVNDMGLSEVHIAMLGDIIESFTGLNHMNSWKGMEIGAHGGNVLIMAYEILENFLNKINNLHSIYIVSGNHDRVTSNNQEDVEGDVAKLISYFLKRQFKETLNVEFNSMVITKVIDNICYIMTHGHLGLSKKSIEKIIWNYGKQGYYNLVLSGHLHSRGKKENYITTETVFGDSSDYRGIVCPSIFTGNFYSESLGFTSTAGFLIITNMFNKPMVLDIPLG